MSVLCWKQTSLSTASLWQCHITGKLQKPTWAFFLNLLHQLVLVVNKVLRLSCQHQIWKKKNFFFLSKKINTKTTGKLKLQRTTSQFKSLIQHAAAQLQSDTSADQSSTHNTAEHKTRFFSSDKICSSKNLLFFFHQT